MRHARGGEVLLSDAERGDVTDLFAETCGDDGTDCGGPGEGFAMHRFAGWIEERVAEAERKAADHDAFGVEEIDEDGDGLAEFLADDANDIESERVALLHGAGYIAGGKGCRDRGEGGGVATGERGGYFGSGDLGHAAAACPAFDRAWLAVADRAIGSEANMADLAGIAGGAAEEGAIEDEAGAEAGAHGEEDEVGDAATGTEVELGQGTGVGVVLESAGDAELGCEDGADGNVDPGREVGWRLNEPAIGVERSTAADADAGEVRRRGAVGGQGFAKEMDDLRDGGGGAGGGECGEDGTREDVRWIAGEDDGGLGAADVDAGEQAVSHPCPTSESRELWPSIEDLSGERMGIAGR